MKKRVNTTWKEFFKTGKFKKDIEIETIKETYWKLEITYINGKNSNIVTTRSDSNEFNGRHGFNKILEWFMCSDNLYYLFKYDSGIRVFVRSQISEIAVDVIIKEKEIKNGKG